MGNEISYAGFCALGGLTNPRLYTRTFKCGYYYTRYYMY